MRSWTQQNQKATPAIIREVEPPEEAWECEDGWSVAKHLGLDRLGFDVVMLWRSQDRVGNNRANFSRCSRNLHNMVRNWDVGTSKNKVMVFLSTGPF